MVMGIDGPAGSQKPSKAIMQVHRTIGYFWWMTLSGGEGRDRGDWNIQTQLDQQQSDGDAGSARSGQHVSWLGLENRDFKRSMAMMWEGSIVKAITRVVHVKPSLGKNWPRIIGNTMPPKLPPEIARLIARLRRLRNQCGIVLNAHVNNNAPDRPPMTPIDTRKCQYEVQNPKEMYDTNDRAAPVAASGRGPSRSNNGSKNSPAEKMSMVCKLKMNPTLVLDSCWSWCVAI
ncbi:hypothetical protein H2202_010864 [Exophiala xenobiotica]|nr:hypothetical protein H2202_010864 [Exophiala xenobiotica]